MAVSPEHQFVAEEINSVLLKYANTKLLGVLESERKKFDYSCTLERDCQRVLVSQVLWSHTEGIHKDLMTLLHDHESLLKVYFIKDTTKHRLKIEEVISEYKSNPNTKPLLKGLRLIFLPSDFDADKESEQKFMSNYMSQLICRDLLFGVVFGRLSKFDIRVFANHGGPFGLKLAVLDEVTKNGLIHSPTFKKNLGYSTSGPLREITTMLSALGLVRRLDRSTVLLPSIKGRMFMDLARRLMYQDKHDQKHIEELDAITNLLCPSSTVAQPNYFDDIKRSAIYCEKEFGRDLLQEINVEQPKFYKTYAWQELYEQIKSIPGTGKDIFEEPDCDFILS